MNIPADLDPNTPPPPPPLEEFLPRTPTLEEFLGPPLRTIMLLMNVVKGPTGRTQRSYVPRVYGDPYAQPQHHDQNPLATDKDGLCMGDYSPILTVPKICCC